MGRREVTSVWMKSGIPAEACREQGGQGPPVEEKGQWQREASKQMMTSQQNKLCDRGNANREIKRGGLEPRIDFLEQVLSHRGGVGKTSMFRAEGMAHVKTQRWGREEPK